MNIAKAKKQDEKELKKFFKHYGKLAEDRLKSPIVHTIIAREKGIIGCIQWQVKEDPRQGTIELEELYVNPEHRGKGIATRLIREALENAAKEYKKEGHQLRQAYLFVSKNNKAARKAYENNEFRKGKNIGKIFGTEDQIIYTKNI